MYEPRPSRNKRSVWSVSTKPFKDAHFATFPDTLIVDCIKAGSPENGLILDPFMGSGTTAVVARKLSRNYIGFELNPEYVEISNRRIKKELGIFNNDDTGTKHAPRLDVKPKIDHAVGTVEAFLSRTGKVPYVSFSGGKDSTVLLDIVRRFVDRDIKAVFCNTGNEYPEIVRFVRSTENVTIIRPGITVRKVIGKYGFPLISKEQAHGIRQAKTTKSEKLLAIRLHGTDATRGYTSGKIANRWQYLIKQPFMISEQCCDCLKNGLCKV